MISFYSNIRIAGVTAAVPANKESITDLSAALPKDVAFKLKRVAALAGLDARHVAPPGMTASKLAIEAGKEMLTRLGWPPKSIDLLFFVTQTPDYLLPSTGYYIHNALNLSPHCIVTDIIASCSGMVQGLWAACGHLRHDCAHRILVLTADTMSKTFSSADWGNKVLFGDAAGGIALEYDPEHGGAIHFSLDSFPDANQALTLYRSGYKQKADDPEGFVMDGAQIMDFSQTLVPSNIQNLLDRLGVPISEVDGFFMHQPNSAILNRIALKINISPEKMPNSIAKYGNCSSASIPVVLCDSAPHLKQRSLRSVLCAFGGGLAIASAYTQLVPSVCFPIITVN